MDVQTFVHLDKTPVILIVDDDQDNLDLIREQVSLLIDCSVITALDGNTALALAREFRPSLILLDIWLPGLDGFQVVQQLQQDPHTEAIPVIAVTAAAKSQDQTQVAQVGFSDYIRKPYDLEVLKAAIDRCLTKNLSFETRKMTEGCHCN